MKNFAKIIIFSYLLLATRNEIVIAETIHMGPFSSIAEANKTLTDINIRVNGAPYTLSKSEVSSWIKEKNDLAYMPNYQSEIENGHICKYQKSIACALTFSAKQEGHIQKTSVLFLDTNSINKFVDDLSRQTDRDPTNAKLTMENGRVSVFSLSQKGLALDKEKGVAVLTDYFTQKKSTDPVNLPYIEKDPEVSIDSIDNLGITELIGEGRSDFRGSPKNRIFNIRVATNRFNGMLIKPNEEFSFVKILGEVDGEHGYLPELVIKKNKTEPEFGGGICQVSTTAFRAAIYSGLKITARRNHAYPVSYYSPQGMDSTVYVPRPDLRFINNTPSYILIQTEIIGTELIFRFYGTSDGRKTNVIGPKILEKNSDGSMKTTFTQQILDANGNQTREDVFNSNYDSPNKYPHPGQTLTQKPKDWSSNEWSQYLKENARP